MGSVETSSCARNCCEDGLFNASSSVAFAVDAVAAWKKLQRF